MPELNIIGAKEENRYYPYQQAFRVTRNSFWQAGQDSFTRPPSQNPDMFQGLTNVEPVLQGNLQRRRGYSLFSSQSPSVPYRRGYSFRSETLNIRELVFTSSGNVLAINEDGSAYLSTIFTPVMTASFIPRMVLSRSYGYFADGARPDYVKWDGTINSGNVTNWGIDINDVAGLVVGPNGPTTATDLGSSGSNASSGPNSPSAASNALNSGGGVAWLNVTNVFAPDGSFAQVNFPLATPGDRSEYILATGYGFAIPGTATITGIVVKALTASDSNAAGVSDQSVKLWKSVVLAPNDHANGSNWGLSFSYQTYGSSMDLWGTTWTPADINSSGFGVAYAAKNLTSNGRSGYVDYISVTVYYTVPSGGSWTNPNNILVQDGAVATAVAVTSPSSSLRASNFGLVPTNPPIGIKVDIKYQTSNDAPTINVILVKAGSPFGLPKTASITNTSLGFTTFGGMNDLWGGAWSAADINSATFGVQFFVQTTSGSATVGIDYVQITVFSETGPLTLGAPAAGNITLISGRIYTFVFQNSITGHTSTIAPFSLSTGPLTMQDQPLTNIAVSLDPQVDSKLILATADGGDETTLYLVAQIPNSQTTYVDNTPDALTATVTTGPSLLTNPIYQQTDSSGVLHGVVFNYPPPLINFPIKHKGRIYGIIGPTLYFSKSLSDVTTSTGTITGKWEEAWPATNTIDISEYAETGSALLSDGQTLYIATDRTIRRLIGDGPDNFQEPEVIFNETGVINPEVWQVVFAEGQPVGTMWLTPDNRIMFSDFNTYNDIGTPIQDVLNTVNQSVVQTVSHARSVSLGPAEYYMLYIPTGTSLVPNTVCVYNMKSKKWFIWQPTDNVTASLFNVNATGVPQWIFASQAGSIYIWDNTVRQDRNGTMTPVQYPVSITTSWLDFGDTGLTKAFNKTLVATGDTSLTVAVQGANRESELLSGGFLVIPPTTVQPEIFGELFIPDMVSAPGLYKWYQLTFTSPASTVVDVLNDFDFEIAPSMRM